MKPLYQFVLFRQGFSIFAAIFLRVSNVTLYAVWKNDSVDESTNESSKFACSALSSVGSTGSFKDSRDDNVYSVAKLADGNCWMTQNLHLGDLKLKSQVLTPRDTNIEVDYILPKSSANGFYDNYAENYYIDENHGGYYTWNITTAGIGKSLSSDGSKSSSSICPKGWRLPTKDEFTNLATVYGGNNATGSAALQLAPGKFTYSGLYYQGSPLNQNSNGYWWSSTAGSITYAWYFIVESSRAYVNNFTRCYGHSIRCISER